MHFLNIYLWKGIVYLSSAEIIVHSLSKVNL
jgi:hypothetical protein